MTQATTYSIQQQHTATATAYSIHCSYSIYYNWMNFYIYYKDTSGVPMLTLTYKLYLKVLKRGHFNRECSTCVVTACNSIQSIT